MSQYNWLVPLGIGGLFILLGVFAIFWGRKEEKDYYNSLSSRTDVREFVEHSPHYPHFVALKIGGWLAITIGLVMIITGVFLLRQG